MMKANFGSLIFMILLYAIGRSLNKLLYIVRTVDIRAQKGRNELLNLPFFFIG